MRPAAESGFTLLEMLVALAVLSLAVLALVNLAGENARTEAVVEARTLAAIVAKNQAVTALTSPVAPALGDTDGVEEQASRLWHWRRHVIQTDDPEILRVDVGVTAQGGQQLLSEITVFRGRR